MRYGTGMGLVIGAGVLWSAQGLIMRQMSAEAGTWAVMVWRSAALVPVLWLFLSLREGQSALARLRGVGMAGAIGGLGLVAAFSGAIFAFQATTVANAVVLFAASPLLAALIGWIILGERVRPATWLAMLGAIAGILIMVGGGLSGGAVAGNVAALVSALGFALFSVMLRWGRLSDMLPAVVLGGVFSILFGIGMAWALGQTLAIPLADIGWAMGMGAVTLAMGMVLYTLGSQVLPAAELTLLSNTEVILAPVWVWLVMGETAGTATLIGGAVVVGAVTLNGLAGAHEARRRGGREVSI